MCGGGKQPEVVRTDPKAEADAAAAEAAQKANQSTAARKRVQQASALSTGAGTALSYGKTTLGQ
ncbi:hypothetical protein DBR37_01640 [Herminiimonas sp. KBW02]|uniref:hypothetical protein n=1 Tax=Herminiimonas sp. KBW02 TaxID=2153363 RepID=UPI000F5A3605|nr:hypothetical protein [Herminiimonas sp. KBW02]RQO38623.1 hypothetical protein DBR37_01640 [Herminiimonas sp. KBW02]